MDLAWVVVQTFGIMTAISAGIMLVFIAISMMLVRLKVKNHIYAYFFEQNREVGRELIKVEGTEKIQSKDGGDYILVPEKTMWSHWPPGLPGWMQEVVPTLFYVRNKAEPFDPTNNKSIITARSLRYITDEGMLKQTWQEAKEAAGEGKVYGKDIATWAAIISTIGIGIIGFVIYQLYQLQVQTQETMQQLLNLVEGI